MCLFKPHVFICILDYGNNVRQKTNLSDFLIQVQNGS